MRVGSASTERAGSPGVEQKGKKVREEERTFRTGNLEVGNVFFAWSYAFSFSTQRRSRLYTTSTSCVPVCVRGFRVYRICPKDSDKEIPTIAVDVSRIRAKFLLSSPSFPKSKAQSTRIWVVLGEAHSLTILASRRSTSRDRSNVDFRIGFSVRV